MSKSINASILKDLSADFWKWIYTCKYIQYISPYEIIAGNLAIKELLIFRDKGYKTIKDMILAVDNYIHKKDGKNLFSHEYNFNFTDLSEQQRYSLEYLSYFANTYGYFYTDIYISNEIDFLIDHYIKYKKLPYSPFPYPSSLEQLCRFFTMSIASTPKIDRSLDNYSINKDAFKVLIDFSMPEKELRQKINEIQYFKQHTENLFKPIYKSTDTTNDSTSNYKNRNCIIGDKFSTDSTFGRIVGLFIYDFIMKNEIDKKSEILDKVLDSKYLNKLIILAKLMTKKNFMNIEQSTIRRWLSKTSECIEKRCVLPLK